MAGQLPSPPRRAVPGSRGKIRKDIRSIANRERTMYRRFAPTMRKLSAFAPVAAAYGAFQGILAAEPPALSDADLHYLLAVAAGVAVGGLVGCAMLLAKRTTPERLTGSGQDSTNLVPSVTTHGGPKASPSPVFRLCQQALLDTVVSFDDPVVGRLTGWPHFFHEAMAKDRPTAYGTAYGLKLALMLGSTDGRLDRAALTETLWKLRRSDGGWASRTQGNVSRPEVTAVVLGALATAGCDLERLSRAGDVFEAMTVPEADPAGMASTFVVSTIVRELTRIRPHSSRLTELRTSLLNGALRDPGHENLPCWAAWLDGRGSAVPSIAHTALAVVALARTRQVAGIGGGGDQERRTMEQAVRWLSQQRSLENQTEQIRRPVTPDHMEPLTVRLFTAAWTARALLAAEAEGIPGSDALLAEASTVVADMQHDGIWEWADGSQPLWMAYQGISTLHALALSRFTVR